MRDIITREFGTHFLAQPIDVPVALFHAVFVLSATLMVISVASYALVGVSPAEWDLAYGCLWVAGLSRAARDGIAEAHLVADRERGLVA